MTKAPGVFAHRCEWNGVILLAVHNLAKTGAEIALRVNIPPNARLMRVLGSGPGKPESGSLPTRLGGYDYAWYRIRPE